MQLKTSCLTGRIGKLQVEERRRVTEDLSVLLPCEPDITTVYFIGRPPSSQMGRKAEAPGLMAAFVLRLHNAPRMGITKNWWSSFWMSFLVCTLKEVGNFPRLGVPFWGPYNEDYSILGSILGSPYYLGKLPYDPA